MICLVSHPYHRGGVTTWIKNFYNTGVANKKNVCCVTVEPEVGFISGNDRPTLISLLDCRKHLYSNKVGYHYELGTIDYKASVLTDIIRKNVPVGSVLIPSDDEACWKACAALTSEYRMVGVLHSDDPYYYQINKKYSHYLSGVVSVSNVIASKIKNVHYSGSSLVTIPCGIPISKLKNKIRTSDIVWIGRVDEHQKRISEVVEIAKKMRSANIQSKIHVYGAGNKSAWLLNEIENNSLGDIIICHGWVNHDQIFDHLCTASALLQTSNFEGMSVAVMEALAAGCKIISTRVSGIEDLEGDELSEKIVKVYERGDIETAVKLIKNAVENKNNLNVLAHELAEKHFDIEKCFEQYEDLCQKLVIADSSIKLKNGILTQIYSKSLSLIRFLKYRFLSPLKSS